MPASESRGSSWADLCEVALKRQERCGERSGYDTVDLCKGDTHETLCFAMLSAESSTLLIRHLDTAACTPEKPVMDSAAQVLFSLVAPPEAERSRQADCMTRMERCDLDPHEKCLAPFLRDHMRAPFWQCVELRCESVRSCIETLFEANGCP